MTRGEMPAFDGTSTAAVWLAATLASPFTGTVTYTRDTAGNTHIRGAVARNGAADGAAIFTLAVGYRPTTVVRYVNDSDPTSTSSERVTVSTAGVVAGFVKTGSPTTFYLDTSFSTL